MKSSNEAISKASSVQKIYCDEAGFTGENLLNDDQPFFTFASVAIDEQSASELVSRVIREYNVQGGELKSGRLVRYSKGRRAIFDILDALEGRVQVFFAHKKYALACKFFEYIFEPVLQANNSLFYENNFHRFIASLLFVHFQARDSDAEAIMANFEAFIRTKSEDPLKKLITVSSSIHANDNRFLQIRDFALAYKDTILSEINLLKADSTKSRWVLELSLTAAHSLLTHWGTKFDALEVYFDRSKPLEAYPELFDAMVNRTEKKTIHFGGKEHPLLFNLRRKVEYCDSTSTPGVQLADVLAGALAEALKSMDSDFSLKFRKKLVAQNGVHSNSMVFDGTYMNMKQEEPFINAMVLVELWERAKRGLNPVDGMASYYARVKQKYRLDFGKR